MTALSSSPAAAGQGLDAATLFERYGQELYRFCLGRLRNPEDAADALQNTFLRVHVALEKGTVPQFEAAWLYKIAHNVCLSRREQAGRRSAHETPSDLEEMEWAMAAPEHDHERLEGLADALADLPHNLRQSLLLREWQGLSYAEIADALDTTVPAVETLLYRARKQLATALEKGRAAFRGLFGLRALSGRLSGLLSGAGAAKLAVGAALLAAGGAGIATAETVHSHPSGTPALGGSRAFFDQQAPTPQVFADSATQSRHSAAAALEPDGADSAAAPVAPTTIRATSTLAATQTTTATIPTALAPSAALISPPALETPAVTVAIDPTVPTTPTTPAAPALPSAPTTLPSLTTTAQAVTVPALPLPLPPQATPTLPPTPTVPSTPALPGLGG